MRKGIQIRIEGLVQGVGFRPFVWRLATDMSVGGSVKNSSDGVVIDAWAAEAQLIEFCDSIRSNAPLQARIKRFEISPHLYTDLSSDNHGFRILASDDNDCVTTQIADDMAICQDCKADILNPNSRFYQYPFVACIQCGPRYSIIKALPYDRENTAMSEFPLCSECKKEYRDPASRRFHAQAMACPNCGPSVWITSTDKQRIEGDCANTTIALLAEKILQGKIVAIKSVGGFRFACDATNISAVAKLRLRKHRPHKPFALMAKSVSTIQQYVSVNDQERSLLESVGNPIVVMNKNSDKSLPDCLAPSLNRLGFMLPGTGLEVLLFQYLDIPLVMTSANISGEPLCSDNELALQKLSSVADYFLMNNREIVNSQDDSVLAFGTHRYTFRRARGLCSQVFELPFPMHDDFSALAMGAHKKASFCRVSGSKLLLSKYIGDLENHQASLQYREEIEQSILLASHAPNVIAVDCHSGYFSTKLGQVLAQRHSCGIDKIQHHHAHVAAVMLEWAVPQNKKVLGVVLDGLGFGENNELWGGEFLVCNYHSYTRIPFLPAVAMPGTSMASREPFRNLIAHLAAAKVYDRVLKEFSDKLDLTFLETADVKLLLTMIQKNIQSPPASSMGRLFDAVSAALNIVRDSQSYEGQAAMTMESAAIPFILSETATYLFKYHFSSDKDLYGIVNFDDFWLALFFDISEEMPLGAISAKFHRTLIKHIATQVQKIADNENVDLIALAGGVFQNTILTDGLRRTMEAMGLDVIVAECIPANDSAIALGQAVICAAHWSNQFRVD